VKKVNDFILELESLKAQMGISENSLSDNQKVVILDRQQKELKKKSEQIQEEIQREIEDLFSYVSLKQGIIETLNNMDAYIQGEAKKVEELATKLKPIKEIKGA
jgi:gamma-glutamyl phosphate reductase